LKCRRRFVLDSPRPQGYETERSIIIGENRMEEKSALVAQLAERRFRNSCARVNNNVVVIVLDRGGDLRSWVQIPSRAYLIIVVIITIRRGD
jgi:hypothetical protein